MPVDERAVTEALSRLADQARPVDPQSVAARALQGRVRMRRPRWGLALAAAACVVAAIGVVATRTRPELFRPAPAVSPSVLATARPTATVTRPVPTASATRGMPDAYVPDIKGLPRNTVAQYALVEDCMPKGGPVHNMDADQVLKQYGTVKDYRWLVEVKDKVGVTRLVGSVKGFVLCTPAVRLVSYPEEPHFTYWGGKPPGRPVLRGKISVDVYDTQMQSMINPGRDRDPLFAVVAGRVAPGAVRVEVEFADGKRMTAGVRNGFYIGRTRVHSGDDGFFRLPTIRRVTAYDSGGAALGRVENITSQDRLQGAIDEND
ncbi:hypothetical protein [Nonomuraea rhizosphaerae]|uniref:hypothetical protein n=1 Tax=Nonomuraea rhizosphaerae TaxID=2665663 RepID=UPI001C5D03D7|nr:hypothetical protein [Nonomuraea rhizosphaerae]